MRDYPSSPEGNGHHLHEITEDIFILADTQ